MPEALGPVAPASTIAGNSGTVVPFQRPWEPVHVHLHIGRRRDRADNRTPAHRVINADNENRIVELFDSDAERRTIYGGRD